MEEYLGAFRTITPGETYKLTCEQCRARKVRCDGKTDTCGSCSRLNFSCSFLLEGEKPSHFLPQKRRTSKACVLCRGQKIRCSGTVPQCLICRQRNKLCIYSNSKKPTRPMSTPVGGVIVNEDSALGQQLLSPEPESLTACSETQDATPEAREESVIGTDVRGKPQERLRRRSQGGPEQSCLCSTRVSLLDHISGGCGSEEQSTEKSLHIQVVDSFFKHEYHLPSYSFLHPETTKARCKAGKLDSTLTLAIFGITSLHSQARYANKCPCRGSTPTNKAEQLIFQHLEGPSITRLQALLLIINHRMQTGNFQKAFMLAAIAGRFAVAMRLHTERENLTFVASETRRRIVWSLKLVERYFSIGLPEYEVVPFEVISLRPPSSEDDFTNGAMGENGDDEGAYRLCVRLEYIRRDIMKLTRSIGPRDVTLPHLPQLIKIFENVLTGIGTHIVWGTALSFPQINEILNSPWLPRQISAYLSWHQCHCDLYRLLLNGYHEAAPPDILRNMDKRELERAERHALNHATGIISTLTMLNQQSSKPLLLEFDTAICAYHATRLLLFISRFGMNITERPLAEFAISRAELCLGALRRFFPGSKLVGPIVADMERSIRNFASFVESSDVSYSNVEYVQKSKERDSATELGRQRLAIHSLLRQADFSDKDDTEEIEEHEGLGLRLPSLTESTQQIRLDIEYLPPINGFVSSFTGTNVGPEILREYPSLGGWFAGASAASSAPDIDLGGQSNVELGALWESNQSVQEDIFGVEFPLFPWFGASTSQEPDWFGDGNS